MRDWKQGRRMIRKFTIILGVVLLVVACGNNEENINESNMNNAEEVELAPSITGDKTEGFQLIHEQAHKTKVYEDEWIKMTLTQSIHGRSNVRDVVELKFAVENKTDKTFHINFDHVIFDDRNIEGTKLNMFGTTVNEKDTTVLDVMVSNENELTFEEKIYGEFRLKTEDDGVETIEFQTAINYE